MKRQRLAAELVRHLIIQGFAAMYVPTMNKPMEIGSGADERYPMPTATKSIPVTNCPIRPIWLVSRPSSMPRTLRSMESLQASWRGQDRRRMVVRCGWLLGAGFTPDRPSPLDPVYNGQARMTVGHDGPSMLYRVSVRLRIVLSTISAPTERVL